MTPWTRRRFLRFAGQGMLAASVPATLLAASDDTVTISILHTTDLHGHILPTTDYEGRADLGGFARCATQLRAWRRENRNSILVDVGDVYQGTQVSLDSRGSLMMRCLRALDYDAWVLGNHEFDWGMEALEGAVRNSGLPALSANALWQGRPVTAKNENTGTSPSSLRPYVLKEVADVRIAIVGLTTPALTTWLPPENLRGFEALDPVEALRSTLLEVSALRPDAIVVAGHMGLVRRDDYANQVGELTRQFPRLAAYLGGHTHQNHRSEWINSVLYTQADHFGIYAGKVDLVFDRTTRRLVQRKATTVLMDHAVELDPLVLSLAVGDLQLADQLQAREVGVLTDSFAALAPAGEASDQERLIGSAMRAALRKKGVEVDVVMHGLFENRATLAPGSKTVADIWNVLPYENDMVTVDLPYAELRAVAQEFLNARDPRALMGMRVNFMRDGSSAKVTELRSADGSPLPAKPWYRLALNSYDSQSGGGRFPLLGQVVADPAHQRKLHATQVRAALIDFFLTHRKVGRGSLLV